MKNIIFIPFLFITIILNSCIGTDHVEDYVEPKLNIISDNEPFPKKLVALKTYQFKANFINDVGDTKNDLIKWKSSDASVIKINSEGLATAVSEGKATISASAENDNPNTDDEPITKEIATIEVEPLISNPIQNLGINEAKYKIEIDYEGEGTKAWTSSDEAIAKVDEDGNVTAVSTGNVIITLTITESGTKYSFTINIAILSKSIRITNPVEKLAIKSTPHQYTTTYSGSGTIEWTSSNEAVATVSNSGIVTPVSAGDTTITITVTENGATFSTTTDVKIVLSIFRITNPITTLDIDATPTHQYTFEHIGEGTPQWESSDVSIATVSNSGLVTAVSPGDVDITVKEAGGEVLHTISLMIIKNSRSGTLSGTYQLRGTVTLKNSTLIFSDDFNVSSGLPGGYIYMSNNSRSISNALEVGSIKVFSGANTIPLNNVSLDDYEYVVFWCKPFGVYVGHAELK